MEANSPGFWGQVLDTDCVEAHPDDLVLCNNAIHLINGQGIAQFRGGVDSGHLGVPAADEAGAVDGLFVFMAQFDAKTAPQLGVFGWCARDGGCTTDADCGDGQGCLGGSCLTVQPCTPSYCTPDDGACFGLDDGPTCVGLTATHANECNDDVICPGGVGCCMEGESCFLGYCLEDGFSGCEDNDDCPAGFQCDGRTCTRGVAGAGECDQPGFRFEPDTGTCDQVIGCSATNPCGPGYTCLPGKSTPAGQTFSWGVREELSGLGPEVGVFVPNSTTHTAIIGSKYYGRALPRILGDTFAQTVDTWMFESPDYVEHISLPDEVPLLLWAWDVTGFTSAGLAERTNGTGCDDDAIIIRLCDVEAACTSNADALATVGVGDTGTTSADGVSPIAGVQLKMTISARPACGAPAIEPAPGSYLELTYHYGPSAAETNILQVALPALTIGQQVPLPQTLYIGADGATYTDRELTSLAAGRLR